MENTPLFPAIQLIHDPQALAEKLFKKLRQPGEKFEVKLLLMNFISRLIGCHKLLLLSFYSFLQRYITSHQKDVTHILAYLIQVRPLYCDVMSCAAMPCAVLRCSVLHSTALIYEPMNLSPFYFCIQSSISLTSSLSRDPLLWSTSSTSTSWSQVPLCEWSNLPHPNPLLSVRAVTTWSPLRTWCPWSKPSHTTSSQVRENWYGRDGNGMKWYVVEWNKWGWKGVRF